MSARKKIMSAIQPTGSIHIGNYFGAVQNWVKLQKEYDCVYGVMDYHAMTMPYNIKKLRENVWEMVTNLVAVGVEQDNLFIQSLVPEHTELCWILNCFCGYGELQRMTQFKDKSGKSENESKDGFVSAGLLDYPVLQVADILIYKADFVPVGKDQDQHLELTRSIAQRFNSTVGKDYFVLPETLHSDTPKIKSTSDPSRKMSKSAGDKHYISVFEDEAITRKKIKSAVTDTGDVPSGEVSPGVDNLLMIIRACGKSAIADDLLKTYHDGTLRYSDLKKEVNDALIPLLNGFKARKEEINSDKKLLKSQVKDSSAKIRREAQETLKEVKELVGLLNVKY